MHVEQPRPRSGWLAVIGAGLLAALLAAGVVQWRQYTLLRQTLQSGDDYAVLLIYQAETEYLRLREQWLRAGDERAPLDRDALRLRYEIWVSRVELLDNDKPRRLIRDHAESLRTVDRMRTFIASADAAFAAAGTDGPDRVTLQQLWPALDGLGAPVHSLSLGAAHRVGETSDERSAALHTQQKLGLALTTFLGALTLALAMVALRHVARLNERRQELADLTTSLQEARREAEAASEAKSAFLANISHEIRTPFQGLMGMLSLLRETGLTPQQIEYLRTATESADHLLAILNDILDLSQLETGRMALAPAPLDLRTLLHDVDALMRPQAHARQLALHIGADPAVPERVVADGMRIKQILFNLLSNAIKFSDRGTVSLDVHLRSDVHGSPLLEFAVTDTGIGMDEATVANLFHHLTPGDHSLSRRYRGTGLGLEISRNLARLMGGDITVRSKPAEGSCFTFQTPLTVARDTPPALATDSTDKPVSRSLDVLVAEDHPVNRQYIAVLLDKLGHRAQFTTQGEEAVQAASHHRFDVVLMDLHMPVMDGVEATKAIRALPDTTAATVPIVALTADAYPETRERCLVAGMNDYLTKPVSPAKLVTSLRRLFGPVAGAALADDRAAPPPPPRNDNAPLIDDNAIEMALQAMPRERLAAMLQSFLDQAPQTAQRLRAAVRDGQPLDLRVNAHAAKGAALNLGLSAMAATAEALQEGAPHLPAHEIARLVQRFEDLVAQTRAAAAARGLAPAPAPGASTSC